MRRRNVFSVFLPALLTVLTVLTGCASQPPAAPVTAEQVTVHESVTSAPTNFRVIKRLWVDSWRSAIGVPSYASPAEASDEFRQQAASLGGNGVINFGCYHKSGDDGAFACNGTVVRFQ